MFDDPIEPQSGGGLTEPVEVEATNLDIRDLTSASDSVAAVQSGTWNITNISGTVSLPTGASTLAEQQTQTTHLATIAGDTTDIEAAVELIDDTVATTGSAITAKGIATAGTDGTNARIIKTDSDGELQIDVASIAAGDNNIGNVDVVTMPALATGTNTIGAVEEDGTALGNNQVAVDTTLNGVTIVSASAGRQGVLVKNQGSVTAYIGTGNVSSTNGIELKAGESLALPTDSEVKGITGASSTTIGYLSFA